MKLQSEQIIVAKDLPASVAFLANPAHYEQLMPERNEKFALNDKGGFIFQLKGMPEIRLKAGGVTEKQVQWHSASDKFSFTLTVDLEAWSDEQTQVQFLFDGDFNPMMAMMVKKPLQKFIDTLGQNLQNL